MSEASRTATSLEGSVAPNAMTGDLQDVVDRCVAPDRVNLRLEETQ